MLANLFRPLWNGLVSGFGKISARFGISPDVWTFLSFGTALLSAVYVVYGELWVGLALAIVMLLFDALDGATARALGVKSKFGMVFDHVVDRYAEFVVFGGLLVGEWISPIVVMFALAGTFMASYVRAKAESTGEVADCAVGIAGRVEKLLLIYLGIAFLAMGWSRLSNYLFILVGLISHITVVQRMLHARSKLSGLPSSKKKVMRVES